MPEQPILVTCAHNIRCGGETATDVTVYFERQDATWRHMIQLQQGATWRRMIQLKGADFKIPTDYKMPTDDFDFAWAFLEMDHLKNLPSRTFHFGSFSNDEANMICGN